MICVLFEFIALSTSLEGGPYFRYVFFHIDIHNQFDNSKCCYEEMGMKKLNKEATQKKQPFDQLESLDL